MELIMAVKSFIVYHPGEPDVQQLQLTQISQ
jgi:hypothetical protein